MLIEAFVERNDVAGLRCGRVRCGNIENNVAAVFFYLINVEVLDPVGTVQDEVEISADPVIAFSRFLAR